MSPPKKSPKTIMIKFSSILEFLDEPPLEFAGGQQAKSPRSGLTVFGPASSGGIDKPRSLSYAVIGTSSGVDQFTRFAQLLNQVILSPGNMDARLWPHFPGFEESFHAVFPVSPPFIETIEEKRLVLAATEKEDHARVYEVTNQYMNAIEAIAKKDTRVDFVICVVPEIIFKNCRPESHLQEGHGFRISRKERLLRQQGGDLFNSYDPRQYSFSLDFRRQIKARSMEFRLPIQIIRETSLLLSDECPFGQRQLTPLSDRAWNLSTALYYKSGGKPWKLPNAREGVCYVGIAFKQTDERGRTACSAAQMFLDDGDGIVFLGDYGKWYSPETKQCHLDSASAERLLRGVLHTYEQQHGKTLKEVFLHCRSSIDSDEWAGYLAACPKGVKLIGVQVTPYSNGFRAYRPGTRPIMRGSFWKLSETQAFLWASGFKPQLGTYDGSDVPEPLSIEVQHGEADIRQVATDILNLTKLNYNTCKLGEGQPVTVRFSDAVGEILVSNRGAQEFLPNFKYYV